VPGKNEKEHELCFRFGEAEKVHKNFDESHHLMAGVTNNKKELDFPPGNVDKG